MTIANLGALTVGAAVPGCELAVTAGIAGITGALPDIQARIAALAAFTPVEVNFAADLAVAQATVAGIQLAITSGIPQPTIAAQIAIVSAQLAELQAQAVAVELQLDALVALVAPLAVAGLIGYAYDGDATSAGGEIGAAIVGDYPSGHVDALVLVTSISGAWSALGQIVKVTP